MTTILIIPQEEYAMVSIIDMLGRTEVGSLFSGAIEADRHVVV